MKERKQLSSSPFFTLIELLVVIAIIAILASMLLPALARARYQAKKVVCMNNLKEVTLGLLLYADDFDSYYPDPKGVPRSNGSPWDQALRNMNQGADWRGILRPYWGNEKGVRTKTEIEQCPLQPELTNDGMGSYLIFANFQHKTSSSSYYGEGMRRVGDVFRTGTGTHGSKGISLLASGPAIHYGGHPYKNRFVNHTEFEELWALNDGHWYFRDSFWSPQYSSIYPAMVAHYGGQDNSVTQYRVPAFSLTGFITADHQAVPEYFVED